MKTWKIVATIETSDDYKEKDLKSYIDHNINSGDDVYIVIEEATVKLERQSKDENS